MRKVRSPPYCCTVFLDITRFKIEITVFRQTLIQMTLKKNTHDITSNSCKGTDKNSIMVHIHRKKTTEKNCPRLAKYN